MKSFFSHRESPPDRDGSTLLETLASLAVLGTAMCVVVPVLRATHNSRRQSEQRRIATQELANLMERIALLPADQVNTETLGQLKLSSECQKHLHEAHLVTDVKSVSEPSLQNVVLKLDWLPSAGGEANSAKLTCWFDPQRKAVKE